ncbi:MAG: hypothetical protein CVU43_21055, partial [Chloroflexi bacterium HGW-Chloroflexi-5]
FTVSVVIALPVVGLISETLSRRLLFMLGSAFMALPTMFYFDVKGMGMELFILRILQGIGFSCAFGVTGAIVSDNSSASDGKYLLGILTVVGLLTQAIGPSLGEYLINAFQGRAVLRQFLLRHVGVADNRSQNIVEIMGNASGQCSDGFHLLGLDQLGFHAFAFGDVGEQDGKLALLRAKRINLIMAVQFFCITFKRSRFTG